MKVTNAISYSLICIMVLSEIQQVYCQLLYHIDATFCSNRTVLLSYSVPQEHGDSAAVLVCKDDKLDNDEVFYKDKLELNSKIMIKVPDITVNYTVVVYGSILYFKRYSLGFSFQSCLDEMLPTFTHTAPPPPPPELTTNHSNEPLFIVIIVAVAFASLITFSICWYKIRKYSKQLNEQYVSPIPLTDLQHTTTPEVENLDEGGADKLPIRVYLVFTEDHPKHKEVVLKFANYLQNDFGFKVIFHLWDTLEIWERMTHWMHQSINTANKIIVVWSPMAKGLWNSKRNYKENNDMFTPVVEHIYSDIFKKQNLQKYYFAYFNYCTKNDIPDDLQRLTCHSFALMKDFEELYFRLTDCEKYKPGETIKLLYDEKNYSSNLKQAMLDMGALAKSDPDWYKSEPQPQCPGNNYDETFSLDQNKIETALNKNKLILSEPPMKSAGTLQPLSLKGIVPIDYKIEPKEEIAAMNNRNVKSDEKMTKPHSF